MRLATISASSCNSTNLPVGASLDINNLKLLEKGLFLANWDLTGGKTVVQWGVSNKMRPFYVYTKCGAKIFLFELDCKQRSIV